MDVRVKPKEEHMANQLDPCTSAEVLRDIDYLILFIEYRVAQQFWNPELGIPNVP